MMWDRDIMYLLSQESSGDGDTFGEAHSCSSALSVPICFMYSVWGCQTALLFPAFYDYRAKLTFPGAPQRLKIAILPTSSAGERNSLH